MGQITVAAVGRFLKAGVPAGKPHASLRDGAGLVLRLLPSGKASWYFIGRMPGEGRGGSPRMLKLGDWPGVDIATVKQLAHEARNKLARGIDPAAERRDQARRVKLKLETALADYEAWMRDRKLVKANEAISGLRRGFQPLMRKSLEDIDRQAIVGAIEAIERSGRPGAAIDFRKLASTFFNRQVSLGLLKVSPLTGYRRPRPPRDEIAEAELAGQALSETEMRQVWQAAEQIGGSFGLIVRMGLATGLRRVELASLRWDWVDRQAGLITIPGRHMKAGAEHVVIIGDIVARLLAETPDRGSGLLFPGRELGAQRRVSGWSKLILPLRRLSGVDDVKMHDLRRTFRSNLADLGVEEALAEMLIAHKRNDLIRRYDRATRLMLRRQAIGKHDAWLVEVLELEAPFAADADNVVALARRAP